MMLDGFYKMLDELENQCRCRYCVAQRARPTRFMHPDQYVAMVKRRKLEARTWTVAPGVPARLVGAVTIQFFAPDFPTPL